MPHLVHVLSSYSCGRYLCLAQYVMVSINGCVPTSFAGSEEPAAYGEIMSIGGLGPGVNGKLSAALAEILETKLSISSSRFYVKFDDVQVPTLILSLSCTISFFLLQLASKSVAETRNVLVSLRFGAAGIQFGLQRIDVLTSTSVGHQMMSGYYRHSFPQKRKIPHRVSLASSIFAS